MKQLTDILLEERLVDAGPAGRGLARARARRHGRSAASSSTWASSPRPSSSPRWPRQIGLDFVDLSDHPSTASAVARARPVVARRHTVLPIGYDADGRLLLAMADPGNVFALDDVR